MKGEEAEYYYCPFIAKDINTELHYFFWKACRKA